MTKKLGPRYQQSRQPSSTTSPHLRVKMWATRQFSGRVQRVVNSLGSAGLNVFRLESFVNANIQTEHACQDTLKPKGGRDETHS